MLMFTGLVAGLHPAAAEPTRQDAIGYVQRLTDRAIQDIILGDGAMAEKTEQFRALFVESVDIPRVSQFVMGRNWRNATGEQQNRFVELFEDVVVYTWAGRFDDYSGETLTVLDATEDKDRGYFVNSRVSDPSGVPTEVIWRLRFDESGGFTVVDIIVEGVSMLLTFRDDYATVVNANDNRIDALLAEMERQAEGLRQDLQSRSGQASN